MSKSKKQQLQDQCADRGIRYTQRDTIRDLEAKLDKKTGSSSAPRARVQTRTRASSAVSRSGGGTGGSTRARSAPLTKSAPTTRMRVDMRDYDPQPMRRTTSADIMAVALVVFLGALAYFGTPKHGPTSHTTVTIVAHA